MAGRVVGSPLNLVSLLWFMVSPPFFGIGRPDFVESLAARPEDISLIIVQGERETAEIVEKLAQHRIGVRRMHSQTDQLFRLNAILDIDFIPAQHDPILTHGLLSEHRYGRIDKDHKPARLLHGV